MGAVRLIALGNELRRDDGVGPALVDLLRKKLPPETEIVAFNGDGAALMEVWQGAPRVVVIDAVRSGAPPGTIHRLDAVSQTIPSDFFHYSTHAFSLAEAVELARRLGRLPDELLIFGIEGSDFGAGQGLSEPVELAVRRLAAELLKQFGSE